MNLSLGRESNDYVKREREREQYIYSNGCVLHNIIIN